MLSMRPDKNKRVVCTETIASTVDTKNKKSSKKSHIMSTHKSTTILAHEYYVFKQFGFTNGKAPISIQGIGDEAKLSRFAAALYNISSVGGDDDAAAAECELDYIARYCLSMGYPQSIIDDIPKMCIAAKSEALPLKDEISWTKGVLTMSTLGFNSRQIVYDAVRAAYGGNSFCSDNASIESISKALGICSKELDRIQTLVEKEKELKTEKVKVLLPFSNPESKSSIPSRWDDTSTTGSSTASSPQDSESIPIVLISDPGQDLDDEMMFIMACHMNSLGLISLKGIIANLYPSFARARLTRGTLDLLGLHHVPVGIGTNGGDVMGKHSSAQFESTAKPYIVQEDSDDAGELEMGHELLKRLYEDAPDIEYVDSKVVKGGLTIVITSSMKDMAIFVRDNPSLFASKTREVVIMGGCLDARGAGSNLATVKCEPDTAHNNMFAPAASAFFYSRCQEMNITLTVVSRYAAYAAKMPRSVYDDLAVTGSSIGRRLCDSQRSSIDQLWQRACSSDPEVRKGLPLRCDRTWFINTFCGGVDDSSRCTAGSAWELVTGFMQYDTMALLAAIPVMREKYFTPFVLPPLMTPLTEDADSAGSGLSFIQEVSTDCLAETAQEEKKSESPSELHTLGIPCPFAKGTRNIIGINDKEHSVKDPTLLLSLLKTGYRQGLLYNHGCSA